jgi:hypothetical protein
MANFREVTPEMIQHWDEWVSTRPEVVRKIAEKLKPWELYWLPCGDGHPLGGHRVTIHSISEDGTVTVDVTGDFNKIMFGRRVFGIDPADLTPCDLPPPDEELGEVLTQEEANDNLDAMRVMVRPDLWTLDEEGNAIRKQ